MAWCVLTIERHMMRVQLGIERTTYIPLDVLVEVKPDSWKARDAQALHQAMLQGVVRAWQREQLHERDGSVRVILICTDRAWILDCTKNKVTRNSCSLTVALAYLIEATLAA